MDIYDELEPLAPQERKEAFLRLARQLKEYGDHNPELLRIVEAMGFLSLYTAELPKRLNDTFIQAQDRFTTELKGLCATTVGAANGELHKNIAALQTAFQSVHSFTQQLSFPDAEKSRRQRRITPRPP